MAQDGEAVQMAPDGTHLFLSKQNRNDLVECYKTSHHCPWPRTASRMIKLSLDGDAALIEVQAVVTKPPEKAMASHLVSGEEEIFAKWQRRSMEACAIEPAAEDAHGLPEGAQKAVAIEAATPSRWSWYLRKDGQQQDLPQPHSFVVSCWLIFRNS